MIKKIIAINLFFFFFNHPQNDNLSVYSSSSESSEDVYTPEEQAMKNLEHNTKLGCSLALGVAAYIFYTLIIKK